MSISTSKDNSEDFYESIIENPEEKKTNQSTKNKLFKKKSEGVGFSNVIYKLIDELHSKITESKEERMLKKVSEICVNYEKNIINEENTYRRLLAKQQFSKGILPKICQVLPVCEEEELLLLIIRVCALTNRQKKERPECSSEILQIMNEADQRYQKLFEERDKASTKKNHVCFSEDVVVHVVKSNKNTKKRFNIGGQPTEKRETIPTIDDLSSHFSKGLNKVNKSSYHPAVLLFEDCLKNLSAKKTSINEFKIQLQKVYFSELDRARLKESEAELYEPLTLLSREQTKKAKINFKNLIESPLFDLWLDAQGQP
jgi:hypothetical protein